MRKLKIKNYIILILILSISVVTCGCGDSYGDFWEDEEEKQARSETSLIIGDAELKKTDGSERKIIIIKISWTNDTDETISLRDHYLYKAYQNKVELERTYFINIKTLNKDISNLNDDTRNVKPGATINLLLAYETNDDSFPIDFEIKDGDAVKNKTFEVH